MLPAVGGGTLRDLLVGGERHPPFIFKDPAYMFVVFGVVAGATLTLPLLSPEIAQTRRFNRALAIFDTIGVAAFTVVGAGVALHANLPWYWIAICAAFTCAGGGMLLDIVTGNEPRTFKGEPYEEIAVLGALVLCACLWFADRYEHASWIVTFAILLVIVVVYTARMLVIVLGIRSYRLGGTGRQP
jgi:uncharacterized membrane protein YeiH